MIPHVFSLLKLGRLTPGKLGRYLFFTNDQTLFTTIKHRFVLNYKGLPYRTEWIEFADIESHHKSLGIKPTRKKPDGTPAYTVPAIHDPSTGIYLADSFIIAEYLEETYPDTPSIFPHGSRSLQHAFPYLFASTFDPVRAFIFPPVFPKLGTQRSKDYYRQSKEAALGKPLEEMIPVGTERIVKWAEFREGMNKVNACIAKTDAKGPFVMGDTISWADFFISGYLMYFKVIWGKDSEEWNDIASWNEGRWGNFLLVVGNQTIN